MAPGPSHSWVLLRWHHLPKDHETQSKYVLVKHAHMVFWFGAVSLSSFISATGPVMLTCKSIVKSHTHRPCIHKEN